MLRAEIMREKGTDRARFLRGQVDKYGWQDIGSSYLPSGAEMPPSSTRNSALSTPFMLHGTGCGMRTRAASAIGLPATTSGR